MRPSLLALLLAGTAFAAHADDVPTQIVDAMNKIYGVHAGFRANHAKGVVAEGTFTASAEAKALCKAKLFDGSAIPVTVRFSDSGGLPDVADGAGGANPHGMAIEYHLPGGVDTDMVTNSLKFFPVATGEDFRDLLLAIGASPKDAPKPSALDKFIGTHPAVPKALGTVQTPDSFADEHYYGINAFVFVDASGKKQPVRYVITPAKLVHLTPAQAAKKPPNFLVDGLGPRLAKGPAVFHLGAQLAAPEDQTKDPSQPWPDTRKVVDLGTITLTHVVADSLAAQKKLLFLPTKLLDGIELSDDPLPSVRSAAYAVSFGRRSAAP